MNNRTQRFRAIFASFVQLSTLFFVGTAVTHIAVASDPPVVSAGTNKTGHVNSADKSERAPNPTKIRLRSTRGITQKFPLFFGPPESTDPNIIAPDAVVVILMNTGCPVVNQYIDHLRELHEKYNFHDRQIVRRRNFLLKENTDGSLDSDYVYPGDRVQFLGVHPIRNTNLKEIALHAVEKDLPFRVLHDPQQHFIEQYGELVGDRKQIILSQVLVFDREMNLVYSGAINDQFAPGVRAGEASKQFLARAIDSILNGEEFQLSAFERAAAEPQGCVVKLRSPTPAAGNKITYYEHIQPMMLEKKCHHCHRPGAVASSYELLSYDDVVSLSDMIEQVITDRRMPPWPGYSPRRFKNEKSVLLTDGEVAMFRDWVLGGMAAGDSSKALPPEALPDPDAWAMNEPDFVFQMAKPFQVPASGRVDYVYYPVEMNLPALAKNHPNPEKRQLLQSLLREFPDGLYIEEIEVVPGSAPVVHHIQVHEHLGKVDPEDLGKPLNFAQQLLTYGFAITTKLLGSFTPGNNDNYRRYSEADKTYGMHVEPNANLLFELHYTPNGTSMPDQSKVGIRFARKKPDVEVLSTLPFRRRGDFNVPPNQSHFTMQDVFDFDTRKPIRLERIRPHMHIRGKSLMLQIVRAEQYQDTVEQLASRGKTEESIITDPKMHGRRGIAAETLLVIPVWDFDWQRTYRFEKSVILLPGDVVLATGYWDNTRWNTGVDNYTKNIPWGQQVEQEMFTCLFIYRELDETHPDVIAERAKRTRHQATVH